MIQAYILLVLAAAFSTCGNLLINYASLEYGGSRFPVNYVNWPFIAGCGLYGMNLLCFMRALAKLPVSTAYPVLAGTGFAMLAVAAKAVFGEELPVLAVLGILLVFVGITLIAQAQA